MSAEQQTQPKQHSGRITLILFLIVLAGIAIGYFTKNPIITIGTAIPASFYAVYLTGNLAGRIGAIAVSGSFIAELVCILGKIHIDMAKIFRTAEKLNPMDKLNTKLPGIGMDVKTLVPGVGQANNLISDYIIPITDIKNLFPILIVLLSFFYLTRSDNKYSKWIAFSSILAAVCIIYLMNPLVIGKVIQKASGLIK